MGCYGALWGAMGLYRAPWAAMGHYRVPSNPMGGYGAAYGAPSGAMGQPMGHYRADYGALWGSPCPGRPSWQRIRIQWSEMLRITNGCSATATLPGTPPAITGGAAGGGGVRGGPGQWGLGDGWGRGFGGGRDQEAGMHGV